MPPRSSHRLLVAIALSATILMTIYVATTIVSVSSKKISSQGNAAIMLYWDRACKNATASIDWGTIMSGASNVETFYVRNEGKTALRLTLITKNWNPADAANYLSVSWNLEGVTISSKKVMKATVILTPFLNQTFLSNFDFDIDVTGTQT